MNVNVLVPLRSCIFGGFRSSFPHFAVLRVPAVVITPLAASFQWVLRRSRATRARPKAKRVKAKVMEGDDGEVSKETISVKDHP